jgi:hypothetical protein
MNEDQFKKGLQDMREMRLTEEERATMLERILATPLPSPYARYLRVLVHIRKPATVFLMASLILVLSTGGLAYAAEASLPGDVLYAIKTKLVEPILDKVNIAPEKRVVWEEKKVVRRLEEARQLSAKHRLDEDKTVELEEKIEKSAAAFATAADKASAGIATSTRVQEDRAEKLKRDFEEKLKDKKEVGEREENVERLKSSAVKALRQKGDEKGSKGSDRKGGLNTGI